MVGGLSMKKEIKRFKTSIHNVSIYHYFSYMFSAAGYRTIPRILVYCLKDGNTYKEFTVAYNFESNVLWMATQETYTNVALKAMHEMSELIKETLTDIEMQVNVILVAPKDKKKCKKHANLFVFDTPQDAFAYMQTIPDNIAPTDINDFETNYACFDYLMELVWDFKQISANNAGKDRLNAMAKKHNISGCGIGEAGKISIPDDIENIVANELKGSDVEKKWVAATQDFLIDYHEKEFPFSEYWKKVDDNCNTQEQ